MAEIRTEIEIDAPAERVWAILTDFDRFPEWNPFIRKIAGKAEPGAKLEVRIEPQSGRGMTFRPTVLAAEPQRELRWLGRVLLPGLFDGEHSFRLEPFAGGRVRFVQSERFSGVLVPLFRGTLGRTEEGFVQMNEALKRQAEAAATAGEGT
jgi:hypothetical protein